MKTIKFDAMLAKDLHQVIATHDPAAMDHGVAAHYLAATMGFWVGQLAEEQRSDAMEKLYKLAVHVIHDLDQNQSNAKAAQPASVQKWTPQ